MLLDRGAHALSVSEVMQRTTLTRKAFYVHFTSRTDLLLALLQPLREPADAALAAWQEGPDFERQGRAALLQAARVYRDHGLALRAVFWDGGEAPDIVAVRRELTRPILDAARRAVLAGPVVPADPEGTAVALATMNLHVLLDRAPASTDEELASVVDVLSAIWSASLGR